MKISTLPGAFTPTFLPRSTAVNNRITKQVPMLATVFAALFMILGFVNNGHAQINYVYHEQTTNNPGCGPNYMSTTTPNGGTAVTVAWKVEYQFASDRLRLYYTTDGSNPSGSFGVPSGTTQVVTGTYNCNFGGPVVDVATATIPAQPGGTVVKYIVSAWKDLSGDEIFANGPGPACGGCGTINNNSSLATVFTYTVTTANAVEVSSTGGTAFATYTTVAAAFTAINAGTHTGVINVRIVGNTTETGTGASLNASGVGSASYASISIQPGGGASRTVSGAITAGSPLILFNGADNVNINGLNTGGNSLTLSNTTASTTAQTSTLRFVNDATNNTVQNATILGSSTGASSATIIFSTTTGTTGNDGNIINNNNIGPAGANLPLQAIWSNGTTTTSALNNSGVQITNNRIFNFFVSSGAPTGILVAAGNTDFTITGNSLYQTATRTFTAGSSSLTAINIDNTSGNNFTINNNFIGGSTSSAGGTAWTQAGAFGHQFTGIRLSVGTTTASNVQGNTVQNISVNSTTGGTANAGINAVSGSVNIGTTSGNTIGSLASQSISFTTSSTGAQFTGILAGTGTAGVINISNNNIGGISAAGTGTVILRAINLQGVATSYSVTGNTIGGASLANSITNSTNNTVGGIISSSTSSAVTISGNTVANLSTTGTSTGNTLTGIGVTAGVNNISGNTITNLTSSGISTNATATAAIIGISAAAGSTTGQTVSQNVIHTLNSTAATAAVTVTGILWNNSSTTSNLIERNFIHSLGVASTGAAVINGFYTFTGSMTFRNNMIRLGINSAGASLTSGTLTINGILADAVAVSVNNYYFNSIYIGGTGVTTGTANTNAFRRIALETSDIRNNIFVNNRSNTTGTGKHYIFNMSGASTFTTNYNVYNQTGTGAIFGSNGSDRATFALWKTSTSQDANSIFGDPMFINPTGTAALVDLHINPAIQTPVESTGIAIGSVTNDYDGQTRAGLTPVDIGADAGIFIGAPSMTYVSSTAEQQVSTVCAGTQNVPVLRMEVVTSGSLNPLTLTSLTINGNGTSNFADITNYRIYSTGSSATFATTTPIHAAATGLSGADVVVTPTSTVTLVEGTNYFWLVYNTSTAATGPSADGEFTNVALSTGGGTPTVTAPAGVVTINPLPAATIVSGGGTYCTSTTLTAANGGDGTIYFQGTTSGGISTLIPSTSELITASGTYYFRAQSAAGCWGAEGSAVVTIQAPASISTSDASICVGGSGTVSATSATGCLVLTNSGTTFGGTWTAGTDPVANRLDASVSNTATCAFESPAVSRNYVVTTFRVTAAATYTFTMTDNGAYDGMGYLVSGAFTPGNCAGGGTWIKGDDDSNPVGSSDEPQFTAALVTGTTYKLISTTYSTTAGTFSGSFTWTTSSAPGGGQILLEQSTGNIEWYTTPTGGTAIGTGSPFNPVGVPGSGLSNTNTAGITIFYAACSNSSVCRTPVNFIINPDQAIALTSAVGTDAQTVCANTAITDITYAVTGSGTGAGVLGLPAGLTGIYDEGEFTISGTPTEAGTFNYTVTTTGLCQAAIANGQIIVNPALIATFTKKQVSGCGGGNDGSITVTASGGVGTLAYAWTGPGGYTANTAAITGLTVGDYSVVITDQSVCSKSIPNITIFQTALPVVTNNSSNSGSCGATGTITLFGSNGVTPYTYSIDGVNYFVSNSFTGLAPNTYTGYVKDFSGCVSQKPNIVITGSPVMTLTSYSRNASSCANNGSIELYRTGGGGNPYTYSLDNVNYQTSNKFFNLAGGNYTGYVKDGKGCVTSLANILVAQAPTLTVTEGHGNSSSCINNGTIQLKPAGGVPAYTYSLDGVIYQSSSSFTGLAPGNYTGWVKDSKGCTVSIPVTITSNPIVVTAYQKDASSCAEANGVIQLFRTGGNGPYTYSLDNVNFGPSNLFTGLTPGSYTGYVKDSKGCVGSLAINIGPVCMPPVAGTRTVPGNKVQASAIEVQAYPNPSASEFVLVLSGFTKDKITITVTDNSGRNVYRSEGEAKLQYKFGGNFLPGAYFVQIVQGNTRQSVKVIKR